MSIHRFLLEYMFAFSFRDQSSLSKRMTTVFYIYQYPLKGPEDLESPSVLLVALANLKQNHSSNKFHGTCVAFRASSVYVALMFRGVRKNG